MDLRDHHVERPGPSGPRGGLRLHHVAEVAQSLHQFRGPFGRAPASSRSRTIRPFVALLKWLTTDRFSTPSTTRDWSTRTLTVRSATSPEGFHAPAYADERRSSTGPPSAASGMTDAIGVRQYAFRAPRPGSLTPIEQR